MEIVFSSAYCTLAASSAKGSDEGFLKLRPSSPPLQIQTKEGRWLYVSKEVDDFFEDIEKSLLNGRGWVLQERILSRRIIHFSAKHTYFEYGGGSLLRELHVYEKVSNIIYPSILGLTAILFAS
jgi:hypothetical protein